MNRAPADVLRSWLIQTNIGSAQSGTEQYKVFVSAEQDTPEQCITVYGPAGSLDDGRLMRTGERIIHPAIQFRVRAGNYRNAWDKAQQIALELDAVKQVEVVCFETKWLFNAATRSHPIDLGPDPGKQRSRVVVNANVTLTQLATSE